MKSELIFKTCDGDQITDDIVDACAELFSNNYGVWDSNAATVSNFCEAGARVKMTNKKLRAQCLAVPEKSVVALCYLEGMLVGHAFATVWDSEVGVVGWITQLVVDKNARRRYIATNLLYQLKFHPLFSQVTVVGLVSSNPAACAALAKYAKVDIGSVDLSFIKQNASKVIESSPVEYVRTAALRGSLFEANCSSGAVSSVNTHFYGVNHEEFLEALKEIKVRNGWCLGELLEGHEFFIILPVKQ